MKHKDGSVAKFDKSRLQKIEKYNSIVFPESYVDFIVEYNGCIPVERLFDYNNHEYLIERFLCVVEKPQDLKAGCYDIAVILTQIEDRLTDNPELFGNELIPIAVLFAGDFVCLDFRNKEVPSVVIWYHEESDIYAPYTKRIADSFEDFINMLHE